MDIPGTPLTQPSNAEAGIGAPNIQKEPVVKKTKARDGAKTDEGKAPASALGKVFEITLHDSKEIPPGGQIVGVNGTQYRIPAGRRCKVPAAVLEVLDNAVQDVPELNENGSIIGWRAAPRLAYTLHRDAA